MKESKFFEEVMHEGGLMQARKDALRVLETRFGSVPAAEFQKALARITDLECLSDLLSVAASCRRIADFRRALESVTSATGP